jgi:hypothetical protein
VDNLEGREPWLGGELMTDDDIRLSWFVFLLAGLGPGIR